MVKKDKEEQQIARLSMLISDNTNTHTHTHTPTGIQSWPKLSKAPLKSNVMCVLLFHVDTQMGLLMQQR